MKSCSYAGDLNDLVVLTSSETENVGAGGNCQCHEKVVNRSGYSNLDIDRWVDYNFPQLSFCIGRCCSSLIVKEYHWEGKTYNC